MESIAGAVWAEDVDTVAEDYSLSRAEVLVACWVAGVYGLPGPRRTLAATPLWRRRWGGWAYGVWERLAEGDFGVPDPPGREDSDG